MPDPIQPSFTRGEVSPSVQARVDLAAYRIGLKKCRNMIVQAEGGVINRAGTEFVAEVPGDGIAWELPFEFNDEQTYNLVLIDHAMYIDTNGGTVIDPATSLPLIVTTPWAAPDLELLEYAQSADIITVCHPNYPPQQISRFSETSWTVTPYAFNNGPFADFNVDQTSTVGVTAQTGTVTLTSSKPIFKPTHIGSLFRVDEQNIAGIPPWESNKALAFDSSGPAPHNPYGLLRRSDGKVYMCTTNFPLGGSGKQVQTGTIQPTHDTGTVADGDGNQITDVAISAGVNWTYQHSDYGILQITAFTDAQTVTATVISLIPNTIVGANITVNSTYNWAFGAWNTEYGYPEAVCYFNDRLCFGGNNNDPGGNWDTVVSDYHNFGSSTPGVDDDALTYRIASRKINRVRHLLPLNDLIVLTSGGEWLVRGGTNKVLTPSTLNANAQSYRGSSTVPPLVVGETALYIQARGSTVRTLAYEFESDAYTGEDITVMAKHFFRNNTIISWAYSEVPYSIAWAVRDDGKLLALTYVKEQQVIGWTLCDTDGFFECVNVIPENNEDVPYFIVRRTIGGVTKRFRERMASRLFQNLEDAWFVDCGLSLDNWQDIGVTLTTGAGWTTEDTITMTAASALFASGNVGKEFHVRIPNPDYDDTDDDTTQPSFFTARLKITGYTSATVVHASPIVIIPPQLQNIISAQCGFPVTTVSGLDHLNGETVATLADANVEPPHVVTGGSITLTRPFMKVTAGLPYLPYIQTLNLEAGGGDSTIQTSKKKITKLNIFTEQTRSLQAGPDFEHLQENKVKMVRNDDGDIMRIIEMPITPTWKRSGSIVIQQQNPLPLNILAVSPQVELVS